MKNIIFVVFVSFALFIAGCSAKEDVTQNSVSGVPANNQDKAFEKKEDKQGLEGLVDAFKKENMKIGEYKPIAYEMVGAKDGRKFEVNGSLIEIYEYDPNNLTETGKKIFDSAKTTGSFDMSGFQVSCVMNDNYMLVRSDEHPDKETIIAVFKEYK